MRVFLALAISISVCATEVELHPDDKTVIEEIF